MGAILNRLLQTIRFERDAYVWMDFNDRATGDAFILVVITQILLLIGGGSSVFGLLRDTLNVIAVVLSTLVFWLVMSGLTYAAARFLFQGEGSYATFLRFTGFAFPTLLLLLATERLIPFGFLAFLVGFSWFLAIITYGVHYIADLDLVKSAGSAVLGLAGWVVVQSILGGGLFF